MQEPGVEFAAEFLEFAAEFDELFSLLSLNSL